ncbi:MAG: hypothetical protein C0415_05985 [Thermodesulfovibrio sp.]|nr:hypothetical protein [Thermodesulfovibrio sp.]
MKKMLKNKTLFKPRILIWFSCGAASAVAAKTAIGCFQREDIEVIYCDTLKYEHPDNIRFLDIISEWIGREIKILKSTKYNDIMECFRGERFLVGPHGAPCTRLMKKQVRLDYASGLDVHVFGLTADEPKRIKQSEADNPQLWCEWVLRDAGITKKDCYRILQEAGIELPMMYRMGYKNNNCIGCVKGGAGYWNKIRQDFPERFEEMAALEKEIGGYICKLNKKRIRLFDLPYGMGRYNEEDIECGTLCVAVEAA